LDFHSHYVAVEIIIVLKILLNIFSDGYAITDGQVQGIALFNEAIAVRANKEK
jgi:hypothetical protein